MDYQPAATEIEVQTTWLQVCGDLLRAASLTTLEVLSYVCIRMLFHIVRTGIIMFRYATPKEILLPERYEFYMSPSDGSSISTYTVDTLRFSIGCNRLQPIEKSSVSPNLWP